MNYNDYIKNKRVVIKPSGYDVSKDSINKSAFEWQKDIDVWALRKGRAGLFEDCGLGKTLQQLIFSEKVCQHTNGNTLILAPLAVSSQSVQEGKKFGIDVTLCKDNSDVKKGINITNYERLGNFDTSQFNGVVLDESSILKSYSGKIKQQIIDVFSHTPYKLSCTATPAPNDYMELGNQSEFLGIMTRSEMLSTFFIHDGGDTSKWRLKGHAKDDFWKWVASWAAVITKPSDLGYKDDNYNLPPIIINEYLIKSDSNYNSDGQAMLFAPTVQTLNERRYARRETLVDRVTKCAEIANNEKEQVLIWCDLNDESALLTKMINGAVEVKGTDSDEHKASAMLGFASGSVRALVSKPSIAGWGMNWQNCNAEVFCGLSDSFESYYQAVRRCWRFGQNNPVNIHIVTSEAEGAVKANIERKQADAQRMTQELVKYTKDILKNDIRGSVHATETYLPSVNMALPDWIGGIA